MPEQSTLPPSWEVPQEFRDRVGKQAGRQRAMFCQGHLLLILHRPPQPDDVRRAGRYFWRKPDGSWVSSDSGSGPQGLSRHLDEYADLLERYDRLDEDAVTAEDYFAVVEALAPVGRAARHLHQTLQEARKMVPADREIINTRDRAYEVERTAELLYQEARNSLDFLMARRAEQQAASSQQMARSAHRLNLLAAFFFPIATLSAVFGVNLIHGWESESAPIPFLAMLALGLMLGCVLTLFVTNRPPEPARKRTDRDRPQEDGPRTPYRRAETSAESGRRLAGR